MCQPLVSISLRSEMAPDDSQRILHEIAEFIAEKRKRRGDTVEETLGRNCEDHITVMCNSMHFPKAGTPAHPYPAFVKWLVKSLPATGFIAAERLKISVVYMDARTRELIEGP